MTVKANKGFTGFLSTGEPFCMYAGEIREVADGDTVSELVSIGYLSEQTSLAKTGEVKPDEDKRGKSKRS